MKHLYITPYRTLANDKVESLPKALSAMYKTPLQRFDGKRFAPQAWFSWEVYLSPEDTRFCLSMEDTAEEVMKKQVSHVWPHAAIKPGPDLLNHLTHPSLGAIVRLKEHYLFPIRVDRRSVAPLDGILNGLRLMDAKTKAFIQVLVSPAPPDWYENGTAAYKAFQAGQMPKRLTVDAAGLSQLAVRGLAGVVLETVNVVHELLLDEEMEPIPLDYADRALAFQGTRVSTRKLAGPGYETTIRILIEGPKASAVLRAISFALKELDHVNGFEVKKANPKKILRYVRSRTHGVKVNHDYLSGEEVSRLLLLPTAPYQIEHKIDASEHREVELPKVMLERGMFLGRISYHGDKLPVYLPTDNLDELCLPHSVIGGMGSGKTRGFGANFAYEAVKAGFVAVIIDPAKGEIGDELESVLPKGEIKRFRFGEKPIGLDWREGLHTQRGTNRLAGEILSFFEAAAEEAGAQTTRFLRAAAKAVPNGRVSEVFDMFLDPSYRARVIEGLPAGRDKQLWESFQGLSEARQNQIALPVLNRLDVIEGDDYLAECAEADEGLDFVELIDAMPGRAIVLDVPKGELGPDALDVLAALISTKIDLAMFLRKSQWPVFVIADEPHQYMRSYRIWKNATVESRKWRFGYVWLFHAFEQLPRQLQSIIQAALPHYHIYASSKATFQHLAEEIAPFTVEEALALPRFHALNVVRTGNRAVTPFIAEMAPPPSMAKSRRAATTVRRSRSSATMPGRVEGGR